MPIIRPVKSVSPTFAETPALQVDSQKNEEYIEEIEEENIEEVEEENIEETELELQINFKNHESDFEDLQETSLDDTLDAIEEKNKLEHVAKWPNDAYRDFMELIVEGNISNKIGDKMIKFFNKYSNLENS